MVDLNGIRDEYLHTQLACFFTQNAELIIQDMRNRARGKGKMIAFEGAYAQGTRINPDNKMPVPFVIAQSPEQVKELEKGVLFGDCFDLDLISTISGTISLAEIRFRKDYSEENRKRPILYFGRMNEKGIYVGEWNFTPTKETETIAITGSFVIRRVS